MKKLKILLDCILSCKIWLLCILGLNLSFIFFAWIAYSEALSDLRLLMLFVSAGVMIIPLISLVRQQLRIHRAFCLFLSEPDPETEELLWENVPRTERSRIRLLGEHLRKAQNFMENQATMIADYEDYIENWAHEIKKPLSLMTLMLDNRKDEMSPLVRKRMIYVRDQARHNVEQVLYFSRLGAVHKDYYWEPLPLLSLCREASADNASLLEEAGFSINFHGADISVVTDKKGLIFILSQLISNSVKYSGKNPQPSMDFSVHTDSENRKICLCVRDNGQGIPSSDLPFIFDKGFTGGRGSCFSRSTGMGLYLVEKMARDLAISIQVHSQPNQGTEFYLNFPQV